MNQEPWKKFSVGRPSSESSRFERDCQPLTSVAHVAHVPTALRIVEDGQLRADLVFDKSKLNTERIRVVWLSPNDWSNAGGFRYGNVRFHFDWATMVENKQSYWVESIAYEIDACRILITENDYSDMLDRYDPTVNSGPWWRAPSGEHYWNGNHCLELMFEGDIKLDRVTNVDFVKHHEFRCNIDPQECVYRGIDGDVGGAEFVSALVSRRSSISLPGLVIDYGKGPEPSVAMANAVGKILHYLRKSHTGATGSMTRSDPGAGAMARAVLAAYSNPDVRDDVGKLVSNFANADELDAAIVDIVATTIGLPDAWKLLPF